MLGMLSEGSTHCGMQVSSKVKDAFVEEIMEVVELTPIRNSLVGLPGEPVAPRAPQVPRCQHVFLPRVCCSRQFALFM